jgi:hypothetical protein
MLSFEHIYFHDKDYVGKILLLRVEASYIDNYVINKIKNKKNTLFSILYCSKHTARLSFI